MLSYLQTAAPASLWPEPLELIWQIQAGGWARQRQWKRQDITLTDRAFIAAVVNLPRGQRPWGTIVWLADVYQTSRETLYTIGRRVCEALLSPEQATRSQEGQTELVPTCSVPEGMLVVVTDNRLKRTILTLLLPGGVALRPMQDCLQVALDITRSVGFLSQFINEAGRRAGELLDRIDYSPLGDIILARDETYFNDMAFLIGVDPRTYVLLAGQVEEGCDGEI